MPTPIRMIDNRSGNEGKKEFPVSLLDISGIATLLQNSFFAVPASLSISNVEAESLFGLWKGSSIKSSSLNIESKIYSASLEFSDHKLGSLSKSGFITLGDNGQFCFTGKGVEIIRTLILAEQNRFSRAVIKKPYSLILAESKTPKRKSNLALASNLNLHEEISEIKQEEILDKFAAHDMSLPSWLRKPTYRTTFIWNQRLKSTIRVEGEYSIRIYEQVDDKGKTWYTVWAVNGKLDKNGTWRLKGYDDSFIRAEQAAQRAVNDKKTQKRGPYVDAEQEGLASINPALPGKEQVLAPGRLPEARPRIGHEPEEVIHEDIPEEEKTIELHDNEIGLPHTGYRVYYNPKKGNEKWTVYDDANDNIGEFTGQEEAISFAREKFLEVLRSGCLYVAQEPNSNKWFLIYGDECVVYRSSSEEQANQFCVDWLKRLELEPEEFGWEEDPPRRKKFKVPDISIEEDIAIGPVDEFDEFTLTSQCPLLDKKAYAEIREKLKDIFSENTIGFKTKG